eukprot:jgi/Chlat1/2875/Chrsp195S00207
MAPHQTQEAEGGFPTVGLAAFDKSGKVDTYNFNRRPLRDDDVLIDILYCGICHSDLHQIKSEWGEVEYPMVPGHEIIGEVAEVGPSVDDFTKGQLVGVSTYVDSCRKCRHCERKLSQYCPGLSQTYAMRDPKTGDNYVLRIPEGHMAVKLGVAMGANVTVISTSTSKKEEALTKLGAHNFLVSKDKEAMKAAEGSLDFVIDVDELQDMLDFCGKHDVVADIELVEPDYVNKALERLEANDVRYRFVIDNSKLSKE